MSVYRDSRYDDTRSVASGRTSGGTKVTRYVVKEDDSDRRTTTRYDDRGSRGGTRYDDRRTEIDIVDDHERAYSRVTEREPHRHTRETITIRRDESPDRGRDAYWNRASGEDVTDRELVIRSSERDNIKSRADTRKESVALSRVDDRRESRFSDYEVVSPQRDSFDDREREVQRYIRQTDYYQNQPQQQPQTIIIRQEPIIIRETVRDRGPERDRREEDFQIVKKSDVDVDDRVSRRSRSETRDRDEEYFYEKRVRERLPDESERRLRRPVSPRDSVSQVGRGRRDGYESDDSMVYVRKETREYSDDGSSPPRKRSIAAGAIAGIGAAELIRNHNRKEGKETSSGAGRLVKDAGAGVVGAVAAEAIRRYRSKSRHGSRSRSGSRDRQSRYSRRSRGRDRSESRSESRGPHIGTVGGLGLAAAAVAVGALVASRHKKDASPDGDRRSRSRTRRSASRGGAGSRASSVASLANDPDAEGDRNPSTRNKKTAAAGALGAAAMALYERHRSKSRGRRHSESPNRLKQGVPIALAGLGAAGLAHQWEKRRAKEEAETIIENAPVRGRVPRSRSRGRADSAYYDGPSQRSYSDPNLIQYGNEPLYGNNYGEGYYGRPGGVPEADYYQNHNRDIVPATSRGPPEGRTRSVSSSRSRSRNRGAETAAAGVGAGVAASDYDARRRDKKDRRRRSRQRSQDPSASFADDRSRTGSYAPYTSGRDPYEDANWHATHSASYDPYASQTGFPPPPGAVPQPPYTPQPAYTPQPGYTPQPPANPMYGPQDFPPPPAGAPQAQQGSYNHNPYGPNQNPYAPRGRGDENVSPAPAHPVVDGLSGTRELAMSPPVVGPNVTVQRPSVSTPVQPRNNFPGDPSNPFIHTPDPETVHSSKTASPGTRPGERSPVRSTSRAANAYTPQPAIRQERERSTSQQSARQPTPQTQENLVPVVTDSPSPIQNGRPKDLPEDPRVTAFRQAAYNAPSPLGPNAAQSRRDEDVDREENVRTSSPAKYVPQAYRPSRSPQPRPSSTNAGSQRPPEMQQTGRGFPKPFMPSPDIRPPSDDYLPQQRSSPLYDNGSAPSMPALAIPDQAPPARNTYVPPTEEQPRRERDRSQSVPRSSTAPPIPPSESAPTLKREPEQDHRPSSTLQRKKSVSFNPELDFSDAHTALPTESPEDTEDKRHKRDRDRRSRRRDHDYDAGDDFSDDTPFEDHRRRGSQSERDRGGRQSSRRERSNAQSLDRESENTRERDPKRSNTLASSGGGSRRHRDRRDSADSDETVDLPERFDERGRRRKDAEGKRNPEQDLIAESLDQILGGLGLFGGSKKKK